MDAYAPLLNALMSAAVGAVAATLITTVWAPRVKRWNLTRKLRVEAEAPHGAHARCRICNGGYWTIAQATPSLWLDISKDDVLAPPNGRDAFIKPGFFVPLDGGGLCWSVRWPSLNPSGVDIFAGQHQSLSPCAIHRDYIEIPSEEGWGKCARVFLKRRVYTGFVTVVSADTDAFSFDIDIRPDDTANPLVVRRK